MPKNRLAEAAGGDRSNGRAGGTNDNGRAANGRGGPPRTEKRVRALRAFGRRAGAGPTAELRRPGVTTAEECPAGRRAGRSTAPRGGRRPDPTQQSRKPPDPPGVRAGRGRFLSSWAIAETAPRIIPRPTFVDVPFPFADGR